MPAGISEPLSPERRSLRSRKAVAVRLGRDEEADLLDTEIRTARLSDHIRQTVDASPPLTPEQRERIAALLRPSIGGGDAA